MSDLKFMFKGALCVIQFVCLYHVLRRDRNWLLPIQMLIAIVSMAI